MPFTEISEKEKNLLLSTARQSIEYGLQHQRALPVELSDYSFLLQTQAATFVTLNLNHQLRGCIGTLEAHQPLIKDVSEHAYAAAFQDPRFAAVTEPELSQLEIHISILTPGEEMDISSEDDLLNQLQPGLDGLIITDGRRKATFLPSVWEQLSKPRDFLNHLKIKAGWSEHYWSDDIKAFRYKAINIE